jgi:hypothetical protein
MTQHVTPDTLNRAVKMALDTGEAPTVEAAYALFSGYRLCLAVGPETAGSPAHQAALLTAVNTGRRALLGGVDVVGDLSAPLCAPLPGLGGTLRDAVLALGGRPAAAALAPAVHVRIGSPGAGQVGADPPLQVTFSEWQGGAFPAGEGDRLAEPAHATTGAVLAAALAVAESFQQLRGNPMAGRRDVGLSLWQPGAPWREAAGPAGALAPTRLWLIGLGHLGQAYLWVLGLLPYADPSELELTLQDFDRLTVANDSTSVLTHLDLVGRRKTRAMAAWAEARGFSVRLVERRFAGDVRLQPDDARVALCGVDNLAARAALEDAGFDLVVEAGLGAGPQEYLAMRLHTFPASVSARRRWAGHPGAPAAVVPQTDAYEDLARRGAERCGLVELASRTVGAPFVGVVAATLVVAEVLRRLTGGPSLEVLDLTLRDLASRQAVGGPSPPRFNPGYVPLPMTTGTTGRDAMERYS